MTGESAMMKNRKLILALMIIQTLLGVYIGVTGILVQFGKCNIFYNIAGCVLCIIVVSINVGIMYREKKNNKN